MILPVVAVLDFAVRLCRARLCCVRPRHGHVSHGVWETLIVMNTLAEGQTTRLYCEFAGQHAFSARRRPGHQRAPNSGMYLAYSLLSIVVFILLSPYFAYQAIRYQ